MSDAATSYKPVYSKKLDQSIKLLFAGVQLGLILYGVAAVIFFRCLKALIQMRRAPGGKTLSKNLQLIVVCLIFVCGTLFIAADAWLITVSSLDYPLFKGGPYGWIGANYNHPIGLMGNSSFEIMAWLSDGFMLFRCYIVYAQAPGLWTWAIMAIPTMLYLSSIATGIILLRQVTLPRQTLYSNVNFGLTNFCLIAALNIMITLLISGRLVVHRLKMQKMMGKGSDGSSLRMYTSISTILVESSALYTAAFLMFIIPYVDDRPVAKLFLPVLAMTQVIGPLLVALRLAKQIAWTRNTSTQVTTGGIQFKSNGGGRQTGTSSTAFGGSTKQDIGTVSVTLETRKDYSASEVYGTKSEV